MSSRPLPADFRKSLFISQDGLMLALLTNTLFQGGVIKTGCHSISARQSRFGGFNEPFSTQALADLCGGNAAYLEVVLRCYAQQGWLQRILIDPSGVYQYFPTTEFSQILDAELDTYRRVGEFVTQAMPFENTLLSPQAPACIHSQFSALVSEASLGWPTTSSVESRDHLTGALLVPLLLGLHQIGACGVETSDFSGIPVEGQTLLRLAGLIERDGVGWTEAGRISREHAIYFGMVGSYRSLFANLSSVIFGNVASPTHFQLGQVEDHVDRELNILASAAAHQKYFQAADEIIIEIFNRLPLESQPAFVMDMGCGDGSWLARIYQTILSKTLRGQHLEAFPITMFGVDYNSVCEPICLSTFRDQSVPGDFFLGDITDPGQIESALMKKGFLMRDGLHIRSFIDHNRVFIPPSIVRDTFATVPSGAYIDSKGFQISPADLRQNLVEFLNSWQPYADPHGLLIIEAHCIPPEVTNRHLGVTHGLVFDTYHGFSRQYPVDFDVFIECAHEAGLSPVPHQQRRFPSRKPFVAISVNRFMRCVEPNTNLLPKCEGLRHRREGQWRPSHKAPGPDGEALHAFLYNRGRLHRPRNWCRDATGHLVAGVLQHLIETLTKLEAEPAPRRCIQLLDYGVGTGMATIELLRVLDQSGVLDRLKKSDISLKLFLFDLPGDWFTKGYQLLADCPLVEFHSLRGAAGEFRPLAEVVGHGSIDIVMASMVFHLIPPPALSAMFRHIADVLVPGGLLMWSSPDIGPAPADAILFHDVNRLSRQRLLELLESPLTPSLSLWPDNAMKEMPDIFQSLSQIRQELTEERKHFCAVAAASQVLPQPNTIALLKESAASFFQTSPTTFASFDISPDELLELALIPSNHRCYAEISDEKLLETVLPRIILFDVVPELRMGKASSSRGLAVHWTFGQWSRYLEPER